MIRKLYRMAFACLGVALLALLWSWTHQPEPWPGFPKEAVGPAPAVMYEVERDFGWRTGDVVPVTIYIKEFPGTSVDVSGLALEGDFEVRGDMQVDSQVTADGGKVIRVRMNVQSFAFKPVVTARVSLTWNRTGTRDWQELPRTELQLHTSPTWDGRENIQEGHLKFLQGTHLLRLAAYLLLSIGIFIGSTMWIRYIVRTTPPVPPPPPRPKTLYEWAMDRFDAAWLRIENGDRSDEVFREIDHVVRKLMDVETVQISHIEIALYNHPFRRQGVYIIKTCERKIFRGDQLSDKHIADIKTAFDEIISRGRLVVTPSDSEREDDEGDAD